MNEHYLTDEEYQSIKPQARKLCSMIMNNKDWPGKIRANHPDIVEEERKLNELILPITGRNDYDFISFFTENLPIRKDLNELINS